MPNTIPNKERMKLPRQHMPERDAFERAHCFEEVNLGFDPTLAKDEALRWYEEAERRNAWGPDARFGRSKVLQHLGRYDEELAELTALVERMPYHAFYLTQWGARLSDAGRYAEALEAFRRAERISSSPMGRSYTVWLQERLREAAAGEPK